MRPDLSDNEGRLSPDREAAETVGRGERETEARGGRTLHMDLLGASGLVDFSQVYSWRLTFCSYASPASKLSV